MSQLGRPRIAPELECNLHPEKDRDVKIIINRCDLCNDHVTEAPDDIEAQIDKLDEVDDSFEIEYDKHEPRLLLCNYCQREYLILGYQLA